MNAQTQVAERIGLVDPVGRAIGFLIPVFQLPEANQVKVEIPDRQGLVRGYASLDPPELPLIHTERAASRIGDPCHWAFAFGSNDIILGKGAEGQDKLSSRLHAGELDTSPLLAIEVAEFLDLPASRLSYATKAFQKFAAASRPAATRWRDLSILTQDIRNSLAKLDRSTSLSRAIPDLNRVVASVIGNTVIVRGIDPDHETESDQISRAVRRTLDALSPLYHEPRGGWRYIFNASREKPFSPNEENLEGKRAIILVPDQIDQTFLPTTGDPARQDFHFVARRDIDRFARLAKIFKGPKFALLPIDDGLDSEELAQIQSLDSMTFTLGIRSRRSETLTPSEMSVARQLPRPTAVVATARPSGAWSSPSALGGEVRDAVNVLSATWRHLAHAPLPQHPVFLRARGLYPSRDTDAWAQLYGRCRRLGIWSSSGIRFERRTALEIDARPSIAEILFPGFSTVDLSTSGSALNVDAAILADLPYGRVENHPHLQTVKRLLETQGWNIIPSAFPDEICINSLGNSFKVSSSTPPISRGIHHWVELFRRVNISKIDNIIATEHANTTNILDHLFATNAILATAQDLVSFNPNHPSPWCLLGSQFRRLAGSTPSKSRSIYLGLLVDAAIERGRIGHPLGERIRDLLYDESFGRRLYLGATSVRMFAGRATADLRLFGVPPSAPYSPDLPTPVAMVLTLDQDGPSVTRPGAMFV